MIEDHEPLSPAAAAKIKALREAQRRDKRIVMSPADAEEALSCGPTHVRDLLDRGELSSILDGKLRRIFVASVYDLLVRRIIQSDPADGPPAKSPIGRFKPRDPARPRGRPRKLAAEAEGALEPATTTATTTTPVKRRVRSLADA